MGYNTEATGYRKACSYAGNCIEVGRTADGMIAIRESSDPGRVVVASPASFTAFIAAVKDGQFDTDA